MQDQTPTTIWAHTFQPPLKEFLPRRKQKLFYKRMLLQKIVNSQNQQKYMAILETGILPIVSLAREAQITPWPYEIGTLLILFEGWCLQMGILSHEFTTHCLNPRLATYPFFLSSHTLGSLVTTDINWNCLAHKEWFFQYFYNQKFSFVLSLQNSRSHLKLSH